MKHRIHLGMEKWSAQTKGLPALKVEQHVNIQNQRGVGKIGKRWGRTRVVVEGLGYDKYRVRIDGSGRVTNRNRQFLRLFKPATFTYSLGSSGPLLKHLWSNFWILNLIFLHNLIIFYAYS